MNDSVSKSDLPEKVTKPGYYNGYSKILYQEIICSSQYIPGHNGTKLAVDIYRTAQNGQPTGCFNGTGRKFLHLFTSTLTGKKDII
jgi:hypothetical protein